MAVDNFGKLIAAPMTPPLAEMTVDITPISISSEPFPEYTTLICVKPTSDCALAFGFDPEAEVEYHLVDAGERLWYGVEVGSKIAVIGVETFL